MIYPEVLTPRPSALLAVLGGGVATLLFSALLYLMPALGLPFLDLPRLVGGLFTGDLDAAFWLGHLIFWVAGVVIIPVLLVRLWPALPGAHVGFGGALVKGLLWGLLLWVACGLLLSPSAALNPLTDQGVQNPGLFALRLGLPGAAWVLAGHLAYGLAVALIAAMGQGISPLDTLGWPGYEQGETSSR